MLSIPSVVMAYWISMYSAVAGGGLVTNNTVCSHCGRCSEQTVCVPTWTTEKRTCVETRYREEVRERVCTVYRKVPVQTEGVIKTTVYVPKLIETPREVEISTPVSRMVEQKYTIQVPVKETVIKTRTVKKCVPVKEMRTVCVCGVERQEEVVCNREVCVDEQYECEVDRCAEVERTRTVQVWDTKKEMKVVIDRRQTMVPEVQVKRVPVTICEEVPEQKVETYKVCVPYEVETEVDVPVCKLVPQTVKGNCTCGK